ncbi:MAG TPA: histidinol-phosphate transaminase [Gaiellaceae bacterium]|nr:histidinol-phosphate transaminase [Gaiellaceae bacterium]
MTRRFREAIAGLVPYQPGKPIEEVQRELGLERIVKLASNEGPFPPFPSALEAMERLSLELNRYPDGGAYALRSALAERHGVDVGQIVVGAGADGVIDLLSQATLEAGDEIVCGWPSFPSYVLDAVKLGAAPKRVPLRDHTYDLDALFDAIGPRTKLVYVCHPNNPTGTANGRAELRAFVERVPAQTLVVIDQAYFEYIADPDYADAIAELYAPGGNVVVLRTFSKIYGLAGARVGYGVAPADVVEATDKVRGAFHVASPAQVAALASIGQDEELAARRALNAAGRTQLESILREHGLEPVPSLGNFVYVEVGDGQALFEQLLQQGVIVRPLAGFGAPEAIRVSVGTPEELELFGAALGHVLSGVSS